MTRIKTHPGQLLRAELEARDMSANQLAFAIRVSPNRITEIRRGDRSITDDTAVRLGCYFAIQADFWMNFQSQYDQSLVEATKAGLICSGLHHGAMYGFFG